VEKRWLVAQKVSDDLREQLLFNRKLNSSFQIKKFSHSHLNQIENLTKLFPEIEKAVKRIKKAIVEGELIYIYGDYDVDGITGSAILWETIDYLGGKVLPYIPSRQSEGYGLHSEALGQLAKEGAKVVISVDCGITAVEQAKAARSLALDLIITDHHQPQEQLPEPFALIHTTTLSGSGVAFRLAESLLFAFGKEKDEQYFRNLELATLGTIADMVPLTQDNRIIVKNGLLLLSKTERPGLKALYEESALGSTIGTYEVGFVIAPRLNAMGRLESAMDSLRLLLTKKTERSKVLATKLGRTNMERQQKTLEVFEHAKATVEKSHLGSNFLIVDSSQYPEGVVGLVASRLVEAFYRPVAVIGKGERFFKGSARSITGFNITEALHTQAKLLIAHGGHPMAAGFSIEEKNIPLLRERMASLAAKELTSEQLTPLLKIDAEISLDQINEKLVEVLKEFEPFGVGNPEPLFLTKGLEVVEARSVGKDNNHVRVVLRDSEGNLLSGIGFGLNSKRPKTGDLVDLAYSVRENFWNSRKRLEARIKDLRKSQQS
jgi:single-stranded-DNA-specific exonuclease